MSILTRYLLRNNLFLLFTILLVSIGIYLLADFFERLDIFLDYKASVAVLALYFAIKIPLIISQILPATFLIALIVQLNILERSKERVALAAGGISPAILVRFIIIYSLFWAGTQLLFSEFVGIEGDRRAAQIWSHEIRGRVLQERGIGTTWFIDGNRVVHIKNALPEKKTGEGIRIYILDDEAFRIEEIIQADNFTIHKNEWILHNGTKVSPEAVLFEEFEDFAFPIKQDLRAFLISGTQGKPELLPIWDLRDRIAELERAGSNIEGLLTVWHGKMAYAASIVIMGLVAMIISQVTVNIYKALGISVFFIFIFYSINIIGKTMASSGAVNAFLGAWFANIAVVVFTMVWFSWPVFKKLK